MSTLPREADHHGAVLPIDPDVEDITTVSRPRTHVRVGSLLRSGVRAIATGWDILAMISLGGAAGSAARWAIAENMPTPAGAFPWATFIVNVSGAFALAVLMVVVNEVLPPSRYLRPLLGVGVLGGFTTFSTSMVDTRELLVTGHDSIALGYLSGTLAAGLLAVWGGLVLTRLGVVLIRRRRFARRDRRDSAEGGVR